jgi:hypothetical protein
MADRFDLVSIIAVRARIFVFFFGISQRLQGRADPRQSPIGFKAVM